MILGCIVKLSGEYCVATLLTLAILSVSYQRKEWQEFLKLLK
jgi:hypothetical protein